VAVDDGVQTLMEPGRAPWAVPLERMSCALDAIFDPSSDTIRCAGGTEGFALYGPYLPVEPGFYEVEIDIALIGPKNPRLYVDLWIEGQVLTKRWAVVERARMVLRGCIKCSGRLEVRVYTAGTGFVVHGICVRRLDPLAFDAGPQLEAARALHGRQLRAAIGFSDEVPAGDAPPAAELLDCILGGPGFLLINDTEIPTHEAVLRRSGIDPLAVQLLFARNNSRLVQDPGVSSELMNGYPDVTHAFQLDILRDGALTLASPFGGGKIESRVSFPVLSPIHGIVTLLYEFAEPHHMIVGTSASWTGALSFVWFVDHDVLVYDARLHSIADYEGTLPTLGLFVDLCTRHRARAHAYRAAEKTPACVSGFIGNMGHYFWNEVSGVERVLRAGYRPPLLLAQPRWLPLRDIFREDALPIVAELEADQDALVLTAFEHNLLLIRPTGNAIDAELAVKVERAAQDALEASEPGRIGAIRALSADAFVLFFNLRAHNKSWIEQVEGAAEVARRLGPKLGRRRILVFLDGYSDCAEIAQAIQKRLEPECRVIDGTRAAFAETLVWSYRCDLFVAVIGSGLVPLTWLAAKPGVCHGDRLHMHQMTFWPLVRPDYDGLAWPRHEDVMNVEDAWYSNYSISPSIIADLAVLQLERAAEM
jgi:hypothetical protein